jgi:hypothetical protein
MLIVVALSGAFKIVARVANLLTLLLAWKYVYKSWQLFNYSVTILNASALSVSKLQIKLLLSLRLTYCCKTAKTLHYGTRCF